MRGEPKEPPSRGHPPYTPQEQRGDKPGARCRARCKGLKVLILQRCRSRSVQSYAPAAVVPRSHLAKRGRRSKKWRDVSAAAAAGQEAMTFQRCVCRHDESLPQPSHSTSATSRRRILAPIAVAGRRHGGPLRHKGIGNEQRIEEAGHGGHHGPGRLQPVQQLVGRPLLRSQAGTRVCGRCVAAPTKASHKVVSQSVSQKRSTKVHYKTKRPTDSCDTSIKAGRPGRKGGLETVAGPSTDPGAPPMPAGSHSWHHTRTCELRSTAGKTDHSVADASFFLRQDCPEL